MLHSFCAKAQVTAEVINSIRTTNEYYRTPQLTRESQVQTLPLHGHTRVTDIGGLLELTCLSHTTLHRTTEQTAHLVTSN